jgi:hypothetical protein
VSGATVLVQQVSGATVSGATGVRCDGLSGATVVRCDGSGATVLVQQVSPVQSSDAAQTATLRKPQRYASRNTTQTATLRKPQHYAKIYIVRCGFAAVINGSKVSTLRKQSHRLLRLRRQT